MRRMPWATSSNAWSSSGVGVPSGWVCSVGWRDFAGIGFAAKRGRLVKLRLLHDVSGCGAVVELGAGLLVAVVDVVVGGAVFFGHVGSPGCPRAAGRRAQGAIGEIGTADYRGDRECCKSLAVFAAAGRLSGDQRPIP